MCFKSGKNNYCKRGRKLSGKKRKRWLIALPFFPTMFSSAFFSRSSIFEVKFGACIKPSWDCSTPRKKIYMKC